MNLFDLQGKTALITGASQGLGARFAITLATAGAKVILAARQTKKLTSLVDAIKQHGHQAVSLTLDVTDYNAVNNAVDQLIVQGETIDILVNNSGTSLLTPVFDCDDMNDQESNNAFVNMMQTNVMGSWYVTRKIANHMKQENLKGSIINIASVCGQNKLRSNLTGYCASKAAIIQMTKALVGELATANIRINCIVPGLVHTPLTEHRVGVQDIRKEIEKTIPLHFIAEPSDLDGALLLLASNKASRYATGSCITLDGGVSWGGAYDYYVFQNVIY